MGCLERWFQRDPLEFILLIYYMEILARKSDFSEDQYDGVITNDQRIKDLFQLESSPFTIIFK